MASGLFLMHSTVEPAEDFTAVEGPSSRSLPGSTLSHLPGVPGARDCSKLHRLGGSEGGNFGDTLTNNLRQRVVVRSTGRELPFKQ
jgi:hypothetical protein